LRQHRLRIARADRVGELIQELALRQAEELFERFDRQAFFADAQQPVEQREGVAHRARAGLGDQQQGVVVRLHLLLRDDVLQVGRDLARRGCCGNRTAGSG
jgi:hypothetical protein